MPQKAWSQRDERQYESIKESQRKRGTSAERAAEIAARTVNKRRQEEGRTARRTPGGTGNPNTPLDERTVSELRNRARQLDIEGRSSMTKARLVEAIRKAQ
jgi:plasmid stabilization system protein ParE